MKLDTINNPCLKHATTEVSGEACVSCMIERIAELEQKNAALKHSAGMAHASAARQDERIAELEAQLLQKTQQLDEWEDTQKSLDEQIDQRDAHIAEQDRMIEALISGMQAFVKKWDAISEDQENDYYNDCASIDQITFEIEDIIEQAKARE